MSRSSSSSSGAAPHNATNIPSDQLNTGYNGMNYVFVKNNPDNSTWSLVPALALEKLSDFMGDHRIKYGSVSVERGHTGTLHLQGYFQLNKKMKYSAMKRRLADQNVGIWIAPARGTPTQNIDYISHTGPHANKAGDLVSGPFFIGDGPSNSGSRTDIQGLVDALKSGKSMVSMVQEHTGTLLKYFGNCQKMKTVLDSSKVREWMTELYIYTGVAGSGKSHAAYNEAIQYLADNDIDERPYMLMVPRKGEPLWWEEYEGQSVVIIDDFYGTIDLDYFKRLIDKYPMKINIKNRSAEFLGKRVYVTSNQGWKSWWGPELLSNVENVKAIERRITVNKQFDTVYGATSDSNTASERRHALAPIIIDDDDYRSAPVRSNAMTSNSIFNAADDDDFIARTNAMHAENDRSIMARAQAAMNAIPPSSVLSQNDLDFLNDEFGDLGDFNNMNAESGSLGDF